VDPKARHEEIQALAKEQLGRFERMGAPTGVLAARLVDDERVDRLFKGEVNGKSALVALTDQRLLVVHGGLLTKTESVAYDQVNQIETGFLAVRIRGSGLDVELKSMVKAGELAQELHSRRSASGARTPAGTTSDGDRDPIAQLAKLAELRDGGVLTEDEFEAKKRELLGRI
jgi:hypothetical protein